MKNPILESLEFHEKEGALTFRGVRYMVMRPETLMKMFKAMEKVDGEGCRNAFFEGGREGGRLSSEKFQTSMNLSARETAEHMAKMGGEIGWGRFLIRQLNLEALLLEVEVFSSPFGVAYGPSSRPVCHMISGVLAGLGEVIFKQEVKAQETECTSCGAPSCRFMVRGDPDA